MTPHPLLPARMLNELAYCPRLFHLEWVQGEWADNVETVEGTHVHRRVDRPTAAGLVDAGDSQPEVIRSVYLSDDALGMVAKIDLAEVHGQWVVPVDFKRSRAPKVPEGAYEPERVQLCAQGLLLRAHGYNCDRGYLYFAGSHRRVEIAFDEALVARTLSLRDEAVRVAEGPIPEPLVDSPKCPRCSLVGICLPDEVNMLAGVEARPPRRIIPPKEDGLPLHVCTQGARMTKDGHELVIKTPDGDSSAFASAT